MTGARAAGTATPWRPAPGLVVPSGTPAPACWLDIVWHTSGPRGSVVIGARAAGTTAPWRPAAAPVVPPGTSTPVCRLDTVRHPSALGDRS